MTAQVMVSTRVFGPAKSRWTYHVSRGMLGCVCGGRCGGVGGGSYSPASRSLADEVETEQFMHANK